jgi:hypothetical protein
VSGDRLSAIASDASRAPRHVMKQADRCDKLPRRSEVPGIRIFQLHMVEF